MDIPGLGTSHAGAVSLRGRVQAWTYFIGSSVVYMLGMCASVNLSLINLSLKIRAGLALDGGRAAGSEGLPTAAASLGSFLRRPPLIPAGHNGLLFPGRPAVPGVGEEARVHCPRLCPPRPCGLPCPPSWTGGSTWPSFPPSAGNPLFSLAAHPGQGAGACPNQPIRLSQGRERANDEQGGGGSLEGPAHRSCPCWFAPFPGPGGGRPLPSTTQVLGLVPGDLLCS